MAEKRSPNFLPSEKSSLSVLVTKYKQIIENKESDAVNVKIKNDTWIKIAQEFNSNGTGIYRDVRSLKSL